MMQPPEGPQYPAKWKFVLRPNTTDTQHKIGLTITTYNCQLKNGFRFGLNSTVSDTQCFGRKKKEKCRAFGYDTGKQTHSPGAHIWLVLRKRISTQCWTEVFWMSQRHLLSAILSRSYSMPITFRIILVQILIIFKHKKRFRWRLLV